MKTGAFKAIVASVLSVLIVTNAVAMPDLSVGEFAPRAPRPSPSPANYRQEANLYQFNYNNPQSYVDPDGKNPLLLIILAGAVWGAVMTPATANAPGPNDPTYPPLTPEEIMGGAISGAAGGAITYGILKIPDAFGGPTPAPKVCPVGQSFGKLGTVVPDPNLTITGFTEHGLDQVITRGVSPPNLLSTVDNPSVVLQQSAGQFLFLSDQAAVVLNPAGQVITAYPSSMFGANVNAVFNATSPK